MSCPCNGTGAIEHSAESIEVCGCATTTGATAQDEPWELIHSYSRQQALEDGTLVDVSETAREAGIKFPVALTQAVFMLLDPSQRDKERGQSFSGRLWDVFMIFRVAAKQTSGDTMSFRVLLYRAGVGRRLIEFKSTIGPGDTPEPVVTIMLPDED